jgi:hypothetical protein
MFIRGFEDTRSRLYPTPQPPQYPSNPGDTVTTLAVGEEGGSRPYPQPTPLPYPQPPRDDIITTQAVGEEGGGVGPYPQPKPLPYPQPPKDDIISTQALGEEGGYWPIPPSPQPPYGKAGGIRTQDALTVLREADRSGSPIWYGQDQLYGSPGWRPQGGDGQLSRQELQSYVTELRNTQFIQAPGADFNNKLKAAEFMLENFDQLSRADATSGNNRIGWTRNDPNTISNTDISIVSGRDGNPNNISRRDVRGGWGGEPPIYPPGGQPTTLALGEEGGGIYPPIEPPIYPPVGGPYPPVKPPVQPPIYPPIGGTYPPIDQPTTKALGEEGGGGTVTTFALGEEGGYSLV